MKQNLDLVQDKSIGIGLSCSKDIAKQLGGDLNINFSRKNLTSFSFSIPVVLADEELFDPPAIESTVNLSAIQAQELLANYLD